MKISDNVHRLDAVEKITGRAKYVDDISIENLHYAKTLRSTISKGKIVSINYPEVPKGLYVVDSRDVPRFNEVIIIKNDMPIFAQDQINYLGEPIALIIGADKDLINSYMKQIQVIYEEEQGVYNYIDGSETFTDWNFEKGDLSQISYDEVFEEFYETGYQEQLYMEKQGLLAYMVDSILTITGSMQCPYYLVEAVMHATGLKADQVRIIHAVTGGGFGGKEDYPSLLACQIAIACLKLKIPIKLILDRREDIAYTSKRHPSIIRLKTYLKGKQIIGLDADITLDAGPYLGLSDIVLQRAVFTVSGCYKIEHLKVHSKTVKTNNVFTGAFRGFGGPQVSYALEMHMTHLARKYNEDPIAFRMRHLLKDGDTSATSGVFLEKLCLKDLLDTLIINSDYEKKIKNPLKNVGYGVSIVTHGGGFTGNGESKLIKAKVRLEKDTEGIIRILVSNVEMGQGTQTALCKIVASALNIDFDKVKYIVPDTFLVPDSGPTVASRTVMIVGELLFKAAIKMQSENLNHVELTFSPPEKLIWDSKASKGNAYMAFSWSALLARVEVDPLTYEVTCTDIWGSYDVGMPIDEKLLLGQIQGGIAQGLGYTLMENMTSTNGKINQISFSSYPIPTTMDMPKIHTSIIENRFEFGPFGAKSVGELSIIGVAPAIAGAVENALNIHTNQLPLIPELIEKVMR